MLRPYTYVGSETAAPGRVPGACRFWVPACGNPMPRFRQTRRRLTPVWVVHDAGIATSLSVGVPRRRGVSGQPTRLLPESSGFESRRRRTHHAA